MLSVDKHCEILDINIRDKIATIYNSFKLFVQLYSAIIGGAFVLRLQAQTLPSTFAYLADALVLLVVATCATMIVDAQYSWRRFRSKLHEVAEEIPPPGPPLRTSRTVAVMLIVMALAAIAFIRFNPLSAAN